MPKLISYHADIKTTYNVVRPVFGYTIVNDPIKFVLDTGYVILNILDITDEQAIKLAEKLNNGKK